jgi:plastocyanin
MRKLLVTVIAVTVVLALGGVATAAVPDKKPPVKLQGKVTDKGTKKVKGKSVAVEQDDFYFKPTFIKAKPGTTITVKIKNEGSNQHTFTVDNLNIDKVLNPGKKATATVDVPSSGALNFYCRFHRESGMQGSIFTKKGDTVITGAGTGGSTASTASTPTSGTTGTTGSTGSTATTGSKSGGGSTPSTSRGGYGY